MSHVFTEPPGTVSYYNYWFEITYFDDSGVLQTVNLDFASGFDLSSLDEAFEEAKMAYLSSPLPLSSDEYLANSRIYSVTGHRDHQEYDLTAH